MTCARASWSGNKVSVALFAIGTEVATDEGKVRQELSDFGIGKNEEHDGAQVLNGCV